jgi:hypothetical protein
VFLNHVCVRSEATTGWVRKCVFAALETVQQTPDKQESDWRKLIEQNLLRYVYIKLLQDLDAQTTLAGLPESSDQVPGTDVFLPHRDVMGVDQNVRIDEL